MTVTAPALTALDREIILATQGGLPLVPRPFHAVAERMGVSPELIVERLQAMRAEGVLRRIAAVPNHYRLGYVANGMSVWDVPDERVAEIGHRVGTMPCVTHCYQRPRRLPVWPYNLFAMVHGRDREEVRIHVASIAAAVGSDCRAHDVLFSRRILKKTGLRLRGAVVREGS